MRRHALLLAIAATLLTPAAVQAAKPAPQTLTLGATPAAVTFGKPTTLSGALAGGKSVAGQTVSIQADEAPFEGGFTNVATATTDAAGNWSVPVSPGLLTRYQAKQGKTVSPTADVAVRLRVGRAVSTHHPRSGKRVRFSGQVAPAHDGAVVKIQRHKAGGGWKTVAKTTLVDAGTDVSSYAKRVRVRKSGTYRVRVLPGDTDHLTGTSKRVKLTVKH
jgi:hypothetical protein